MEGVIEVEEEGVVVVVVVVVDVEGSGAEAREGGGPERDEEAAADREEEDEEEDDEDENQDVHERLDFWDLEEAAWRASISAWIRSCSAREQISLTMSKTWPMAGSWDLLQIMSLRVWRTRALECSRLRRKATLRLGSAKPAASFGRSRRREKNRPEGRSMTMSGEKKSQEGRVEVEGEAGVRAGEGEAEEEEEEEEAADPKVTNW